MQVIVADKITKSFGNIRAVDKTSFHAEIRRDRRPDRTQRRGQDNHHPYDPGYFQTGQRQHFRL